MKLLYIDAYHHYLNPTSGLLPVLVALAANDVSYYGPGYSSPDELSQGVRAYVDKHGPFDGLVLGMQVPLFAVDEYGLRRNAGHVTRYTAFGSPTETLMSFFRDVLANVATLPIRTRIISLLNFDYYATTTRHTDLFEAMDAYVLTPGAQFAPSDSELPDWAWQERHFVRKQSMISSAWIDYLNRHPDRVLNLPHFIADSEFSFRGLAERKQRISIPGVEYFMRKRGRQTLAQRGMKPAAKSVFNLVRYADRLGIKVFAKYLTLTMYHAAYRGNLIDTRFVYTAREGFGIPLRKFFEIPAAGALMMCLSPHGFSDFGFRDGENYLEVDADALPDMIEMMERNPDRAQAIASAGRKLVLEQHSLAARGRQLAQCFDAIQAGRFAGSDWHEGQFKVLKTTPAAVGAEMSA